MSPSEIKPLIEADLRKAYVSPNILMHSFSFINEESRKTSAYVDPKYIPFYYHLSKYVKPKNLVEFGINLGLLSSVFIKGSKTVENYFGFQQADNSYYNSRLALSNIRQNYKGSLNFFGGSITDVIFEKIINSRKWDLAFVNEELTYDIQRNHFDEAWKHLSLEGYLVADYVKFHPPSIRAFNDFCKTVNRDPVYISTRYGVGLVQK